jgi:hypothetical protein
MMIENADRQTDVLRVRVQLPHTFSAREAAKYQGSRSLASPLPLTLAPEPWSSAAAAAAAMRKSPNRSPCDDIC